MSDFYNKYPYTDFHELNLDWVIKRVKMLTEDWLATQTEWNNTEEQWQELYNYVHDYFDNLDVQDEINNKIQSMISDGSFLYIVTPVINSTVVSTTENWLAAHITQPTTPVVDNSLLIRGAAADSETTGIAINASSDVLDGLIHNPVINIPIILYDDGSVEYINGNITTNYQTKYTDFIYVKGLHRFAQPIDYLAAHQIAFYDENKVFISGLYLPTPDAVTVWEFDVPANAYYIRTCCFKSVASSFYTRGYVDASVDDKTLWNIELINSAATGNTVNFVYDTYSGGFVSASDGKVYSMAGVKYTGFIYSKGLKSIVFPMDHLAPHQIAFYDENAVFLSGLYHAAPAAPEVWTIENIPAGAFYFRTCYYEDVESDFYLHGFANTPSPSTAWNNQLIKSAATGKSVTFDYETHVGGYVKWSDGSIVANAQVTYTDYIYVKGISEIVFPMDHVAAHQMAFYDNDKTYVSGLYHNNPGSPSIWRIEVPDNAYYMRICYYNDAESTFYLHGYTNASKHISGLKLGIIGDSISTYTGYIPTGYVTFYPSGDVNNIYETWWQRLIDDTGMTLCANASWSGSTICGNTLDASGAVGASDARVSDLTAADGSTPDIIVIQMGINDFAKSNGITCGSYTGKTAVPSVTTVNDITSAFGILINKLQNTYPKAKIFICHIMPEQAAGSMAPSYANGFPNINPDDNVSLPELNDMLDQIALAFNCGVIPFDKTGINFNNTSLYTLDKLHPNEYQMNNMFHVAKNAILETY